MPFIPHLICKWCDLGYYPNVSTAMDPETYCSDQCEEDDPEGT